MELGATVCLPGEPRCSACPVSALCRAHARGLTAALPVAKKKRPPREVDMWAVVSRRGSRVLLARRKMGGLFGGLWEPPMVEVERGKTPEASLAALLGMRRLELSHVGQQTHVLTHRKLRITIATADIAERRSPGESGGIYDRLEWWPASDLVGLGMSSLAKKVLLACPG